MQMHDHVQVQRVDKESGRMTIVANFVSADAGAAAAEYVEWQKSKQEPQQGKFHVEPRPHLSPLEPGLAGMPESKPDPEPHRIPVAPPSPPPKESEKAKPESRPPAKAEDKSKDKFEGTFEAEKKEN